jgi:hypothetical protein
MSEIGKLNVKIAEMSNILNNIQYLTNDPDEFLTELIETHQNLTGLGNLILDKINKINCFFGRSAVEPPKNSIESLKNDILHSAKDIEKLEGQLQQVADAVRKLADITRGITQKVSYPHSVDMHDLGIIIRDMEKLI